MRGLRTTLILLVCALALSAYIVWQLADFFRGVTYDQAQLKCLAAMLRADTIGEAPENRSKAFALVADAANRRRSKGITYCANLEGALMLYPPGWKHSRWFIGRDADAIRLSRRYVSLPWIDVEDAAKRLYDAKPDPKGCAEYIVRIERRYDSFTGESDAAREIKKLKLDPRQLPELRTTFHCQ